MKKIFKAKKYKNLKRDKFVKLGDRGLICKLNTLIETTTVEWIYLFLSGYIQKNFTAE